MILLSAAELTLALDLLFIMNDRVLDFLNWVVYIFSAWGRISTVNARPWWHDSLSLHLAFPLHIYHIEMVCDEYIGGGLLLWSNLHDLDWALWLLAALSTRQRHCIHELIDVCWLHENQTLSTWLKAGLFISIIAMIFQYLYVALLRWRAQRLA